jgi:hypothetical protein
VTSIELPVEQIVKQATAILYKIYIIQSYTSLYIIRLYYVIIPATCFGPIVGSSSGWSLSRWGVKLIILSIYEISCYNDRLKNSDMLYKNLSLIFKCGIFIQ